MNVVLYLCKELWALIAEDCSFSLAILSWVFIAASMKALILDEAWRAPVFLIGLIAILLFSIATTYRPTHLATKREKNNL